VLSTEHDAIKAYWGSGGIAPFILSPRHQMEVVSSMTRPLYLQGK